MATPAQFLDIVAESINKLPFDGEFATVMPLNRWTVMDAFFSKPVDFPAGKEDQFETARGVPDALTYIQPLTYREATIKNHFVTATQPLVAMTYANAWAEHELQVQGALVKDRGAAIVKVVEARRQLNKLGFYKGIERDFWRLPNLVASAMPTLYGFPFHVTAITAAQVAAGTGAGAYQGLSPQLKASSSTQNWCGLDLSGTYTDMGNWNAAWDAAAAASITMTDENLIRIARALRQLGLEGPMDLKDLNTSPWSNNRIITDQFIIEKLGLAQKASNDSLGNDALKYLATGVRIGSSNNGVVLNGLPVRYESELDDDGTSSDVNVERRRCMGNHPMCFLNLDLMYFTARRGQFMNKRPVASDAVHQPDGLVEHVDTIGNFRSKDHQKAGAIISYPTV